MSLSFRFLHKTPVRTYVPTHHIHLGFVTRNILAIITNYEASYYAISSIPLIPSIYPFAPQCLQPSLTIILKVKKKFSLGMHVRKHAIGNGLFFKPHTRGQWVVSFGCRSSYSRQKKIPLHPLNRNWVRSRAILNIFGEKKIILLKPRAGSRVVQSTA